MYNGRPAPFAHLDIFRLITRLSAGGEGSLTKYTIFAARDLF